MSVATCAAKLAIVLLAAQTPQRQTFLTLPERVALARPILFHAEEAATTADPAARAFLLYRAAGAWLDLDLSHAIVLYRQAFAAARLIEPISLRKGVERDILSDLVPLSPSALLDLIPQAEPETQVLLYRAVVNFSLTQGDLSGAIKSFDQASAAGIFSERAAALLLGAASTSSTDDRVRIFNSALAAYNSQTPDQSKTWTASRLVAHYWQSLPADVILSAINIVLGRAAEKDKQHTNGSGNISSGRNSLSYKSNTDLELFAVAPALSKLDPPRAAALLAIHPAVEEYLQRFPDGLASFEPFGSDRISLTPSIFLPMGTASYATEKGAHSIGLTSLDMGLEFTIPLNLNQGLGVTGSTLSYAPPGSPEAALLGTGNTCPPDVAHILASAGTVPLTRQVPTTCGGPNGDWCSYAEQSPRADMLNNIAERCTYYLDEPAARSALTAELELITQLKPEQRPEYLTKAADLYLRLGDRDAAASVVQNGFEVAATLFTHDNESSGLKSFPKAVWSSAEVYRRMISLGVNADFDRTRTTVEAIPDPELRELELVMLARSLLGIPVRRRIVFYAGGSSMAGHSEPGYDDF
jgi:hypothetical protein